MINTQIYGLACFSSMTKTSEYLCSEQTQSMIKQALYNEYGFITDEMLKEANLAMMAGKAVNFAGRNMERFGRLMPKSWGWAKNLRATGKFTAGYGTKTMQGAQGVGMQGTGLNTAMNRMTQSAGGKMIGDAVNAGKGALRTTAGIAGAAMPIMMVAPMLAGGH